jgi:hypothetical protein
VTGQADTHGSNGGELAPMIIQLLALIGAVVKGWTDISGRFSRIRQFERDTGGLQASFRFLYQVPQYVNVALLVCLISGALAALLGGLMTGVVPGVSLPGSSTIFGRVCAAIYSSGWLLVIAAAALFASIYFDLVARLFLRAAGALSLVPTAQLEERFGPEGRSVGWYQAKEFVNSGSAAQPLALNGDGIDRVVGAVYASLREQGATGTDRAATPAGSASVKGNIALFACIFEQIDNDLRLPRRKLDQFYSAFDDVSQKCSFFEPAALLAIADGSRFLDELRSKLDVALKTRSEPLLPNIPASNDDIVNAFNLLKKNYKCDVTNIPKRNWLRFASPAYGMYRRASMFPRLNNDTMRPQFVKLCLRWGAIELDLIPGFSPAFSQNTAWDLLNNGAISTLAETKEVVFAGAINRPIARLAAQSVIQKTADAVEKDETLMQQRLGLALSDLTPEKRRWLVEQEVDTTLWRIGRNHLKEAQAAEWKGPWSWKFVDDVARRI